MSTELSTKQTIQLLDQALDVYQHEDADTRYPEDMAAEIVDSWIPVYYNHIRDEWVEAGCPEPEHISSLADARDIHHAMTLGLWELAHNDLMSALNGAETCGDAVRELRDEIDILSDPQKRVERILG